MCVFVFIVYMFIYVSKYNGPILSVLIGLRPIAALHWRYAARVLLYAPSHRQDSTNHIICYTSRGRALAGNRNSSVGPL